MDANPTYVPIRDSHSALADGDDSPTPNFNTCAHLDSSPIRHMVNAISNL
jgi:hypothetical protein